MVSNFKEMESIIRYGNFIIPIVILLLSILAGIMLSQLVFAKLRKLAVRITGDSYPLVQRAFSGMPTLWGSRRRLRRGTHHHNSSRWTAHSRNIVSRHSHPIPDDYGGPIGIRISDAESPKNSRHFCLHLDLGHND